LARSASLLLLAILFLPRLAIAAPQGMSRDTAVILRPIVATADTVPRILAITLQARGAYDSTDTNCLTKILNFFHVTTKEQFIRNEIPVRVGEPYDSARVAEIERNLRALGVFKSVNIDTVRTDSGMVLHVVTRDVITAQLQESFKNSGGSIYWGLTLIESNLLGTLSSVEFGYRHDPDRNTGLAVLSRRRLINNKIGGTLEFFDRSDGKLFFAQLAQPFFEASSRTSNALTLDDRFDRILQYRSGKTDTAFSVLQNRYVLGRADFGWALHANSAGYLRTGLFGQVRRDDYTPDTLYQLHGFPTRTITGAVGGYIELSRVNKPKVFAFQSLSYDEDVDLSSTVRLSLALAPTALGYSSSSAGVAPGIAMHTGVKIPQGFVFFDAGASGLYTSHGLDSGQVNVAATMAIMPTRRHQLLVHLEGNALRNPLPGTEFDLGLGAGPRAYALHAFTGDREYFFTTEYRFTAFRDFLKLADLGLAAFFDVGGAWWSGDAQRSGWDAGVGLRSAFGHGAGLAVNRVDLAWRGAVPGMPGGWVIAVGKGLLFSTGPRGTSR
jgi:hypothetical protein